MTRTGILADRALSTMSVCVVALRHGYSEYHGKRGIRDHSPKRVTNDKQRYVLLVRVPENLIAFSFDHVAISENQLLPVELFLAKSLSITMLLLICTHQLLFLNHENTSISFKVDPRTSFYCLVRSGEPFFVTLE